MIISIVPPWCQHHGWTMEIIQQFRHEIEKNNRIIMTFACVIMKLFTCGGKYFSTCASLCSALVLQYFPPHVNNFIITITTSIRHFPFLLSGSLSVLGHFLVHRAYYRCDTSNSKLMVRTSGMLPFY